MRSARVSELLKVVFEPFFFSPPPGGNLLTFFGTSAYIMQHQVAAENRPIRFKEAFLGVKMSPLVEPGWFSLPRR